MTHGHLLATLAILAGCSAQPPPASDGVRRQSGSWKMVHTMTAFDASGVSGGMADMVAAGKASIGVPDNGGPICVTADDAAKDTLRSRLDEAMRLGPEWKVVRNDLSDGRLDFVAVMDDPIQGKGTLSITGTISSISTNFIVTTDAHEPAPGKGHVRTVARHEAARLGDC